MELEVITKKPKSKKYKNPILFIHGMWHGAWCWEPHFMPWFASLGFECHALSLRGHGKSENSKSLRFTSFEDYVADVRRVADALPERPILVGHSMGGIIIQKLMETETYPAAVLLAPVPARGLLGASFRFFFRHPLVFLKLGLTMSMYPAIDTHALCKEMFFSADMSEHTTNHFFACMQDESYLAYLQLIAFALPKTKKTGMPLLLLGAENDMAFTVEEIHDTAERYGVKAEIIPDIAHDIMLEKNWLEAADRIHNWFQEIGIDKYSGDETGESAAADIQDMVSSYYGKMVETG
ncbi:MAG: alpha/beta hydrolase [Spirochaetales bacterium]|nr:alpha/beta hydrolase [Spirochaetales bacterium]